MRVSAPGCSALQPWSIIQTYSGAAVQTYSGAAVFLSLFACAFHLVACNNRGSVARLIALRNRRFIERPFHRIIDSDLNTRECALVAREHFPAVRALFGEAVARQIYLRAQSVTLARRESYALVVREPTCCGREDFFTVARRACVCQSRTGDRQF